MTAFYAFWHKMKYDSLLKILPYFNKNDLEPRFRIMSREDYNSPFLVLKD
jgi:hypothetical protein